MTKSTPENDSETGLTRYGKTVYESNPSITGSFPVKIKAKQAKNLSSAYMIAPGTGEILAKGAFGFVEEYEVDEQQFVKIYLDGVRQYGQLSKAGALLFEFVYREMSGHSGKDKDTVVLNYHLAMRWKPDLSKRSYERGMSELLEKGFLFRSVAADMYFVNIRFMFNGNRQTVIKSYRIKGSKPIVTNEKQIDLFDSAED